MDRFPADFPQQSRAAVAAEKLRAGKDFDTARDNPPNSLAHCQHLELRRYILRPFAVFVREACKLGQQGIWQVDRIEKEALEFLRISTINAASGKGYAFARNWISDWGHIEPEVKRQFERSEEWKQFQDALLQVAESQATQTQKVGEGAREKTGTASGHELEKTVTTTDHEPINGELVEETSELGKRVPEFPRRAAWLKERLLERGWSNSEASKYGGPDRKTIERIFRGQSVRNDVLEKVVEALSKKFMKVGVMDIPKD